MNRIAVIVASVWLVVAASLAGVGAVGATTADSPAATLSGDGGVTFAQTENGTNETESNTTSEPVNETETNTTTASVNETATDDETDTENGSVGPGAQLAGVIGVQQAELQGEVQHRAFGLTMAAARSNGSKARFITSNTEQLQERIQHLENRTQELNESYQNGTISTGAFHARMAHLTAQIRMTERLVNQTAASAAELPPETRRAHGVNLTHLERLRTDARNMTGPEVAAVAKRIGGPQVGHPLGKERGPPADRPGQGPPDERGNSGPQDEKGPRGQENATAGPTNNSTMGPNGGGGPMNGNGGPGEKGNQSAGHGGGPSAVGDLPTVLRSLFAAPW